MYKRQSAILTFVIVGIVSMIESTGVYYALGNICDKKIGEKDLRSGYFAEGLAVMIGSTVNAFPYTTYSQNVGLVQISGVKSKRVMYVIDVYKRQCWGFRKREIYCSKINLRVL